MKKNYKTQRELRSIINNLNELMKEVSYRLVPIQTNSKGRKRKKEQLKVYLKNLTR